MKRPVLFAELCAGTAAASLKLEGGRHARPPVSRMGAKTGYAEAILKVMGLRCGLGAERYLWCEPDAGCRLLLEAYRDHDLALAAAEIIRGWKDEPPRELWERLRAEGPVKAPEPREVARWCLLAWQSYKQGQPESGFRATAGGTWPDRPPEAETPAARCEALPTLPATILPDASQVDPREVARWCLLGTWAFRRGFPESGPCGPSRWADGEWVTISGEVGKRTAVGPHTLAPMVEQSPTLPATIHPDATQIHPPRFPDGERVIAYIDPPYVNTTGYGHDLPRSEVVRLAREWADAGADVYISEAEPIGALVSDGWHVVDITSTRKGQKRTFGGTPEFLTCSTLPAWTPGAIRQRSLFGEE